MGPGFKVVALWKPFYSAANSFVISIEAVYDDCLSWLTATIAQIAVYTSRKRGLFLYLFLLISGLISYRFDILKTYGEELKIAVHLMDVDEGGQNFPEITVFNVRPIKWFFIYRTVQTNSTAQQEVT